MPPRAVGTSLQDFVSLIARFADVVGREAKVGYSGCRVIVADCWVRQGQDGW